MITPSRLSFFEGYRLVMNHSSFERDSFDKKKKSSGKKYLGIKIVACFILILLAIVFLHMAFSSMFEALDFNEDSQSILAESLAPITSVGDIDVNDVVSKTQKSVSELAGIFTNYTQGP